MNVMGRRMAIQTVNRYCCSNCWGALERFPALNGQGEVVQCLTCKDDTKGFVSQYYAQRRRDENVFEKHDVQRLLRTIGVLPQLPAQTEAEHLKALGF